MADPDYAEAILALAGTIAAIRNRPAIDPRAELHVPGLTSQLGCARRCLPLLVGPGFAAGLVAARRRTRLTIATPPANLISMSPTLRAAVIGLGSMGANHARVLSDTPGVELVGGRRCEPRGREQDDRRAPDPGLPGRRHAAPRDAARHGLRRRPDAAARGRRAPGHRCGLSRARREADRRDARRRPGASPRAAEAAGIVLTVGHIERFNPAVRELKRRLADGQGGPRAPGARAARRAVPAPHPRRRRHPRPRRRTTSTSCATCSTTRSSASTRRRGSHIDTGNEDMFAGIVALPRRRGRRARHQLADADEGARAHGALREAACSSSTTPRSRWRSTRTRRRARAEGALSRASPKGR